MENMGLFCGAAGTTLLWISGDFKVRVDPSHGDFITCMQWLFLDTLGQHLLKSGSESFTRWFVSPPPPRPLGPQHVVGTLKHLTEAPMLLKALEGS